MSYNIVDKRTGKVVRENVEPVKGQEIIENELCGHDPGDKEHFEMNEMVTVPAKEHSVRINLLKTKYKKVLKKATSKKFKKVVNNFKKKLKKVK